MGVGVVGEVRGASARGSAVGGGGGAAAGGGGGFGHGFGWVIGPVGWSSLLLWLYVLFFEPAQGCWTGNVQYLLFDDTDDRVTSC